MIPPWVERLAYLELPSTDVAPSVIGLVYKEREKYTLFIKKTKINWPITERPS